MCWALQGVQHSTCYTERALGIMYSTLYRTGITYHAQHVIQNGHYVSCAAHAL